jgi:glycosyltransferase involved in cell wall biosynthesis
MATRRLLYATAGYTTHDRRFIEAATSNGWDVLHLRFDGSSQDLCNVALPVGARSADWLGANVALNEQNWSAFVRAFIDVEQGFLPNVIHAGPILTVASVATAAATTPVVAMSWASDLLLDSHDSALAEQRASTVLRCAAGVIVDCVTVGQRAIELGAEPGQLVITPWGVNLDEFPYRAPERDGDAGPLRLLSVRSFEAIYDIETLLEAVSIAHNDLGVDLHLDLAGSGSLEGSLRHRAQDLGLSDLIVWHGRVSEEQIGDLMARCHVHVSTSLIDGSSISLLQAMATGRPTVTTDISSNREWIDEGLNGWLAEPGNAASFARIFKDLARRAGTLVHVGRNARSAAEARADWLQNRQLVIARYDSVGLQGRD